MKMHDRFIEAILFIFISFFSGYGIFSFYQMLDTIWFTATPIFNMMFGIFFGICTLVILILLRRMSQ